MVWTLEEKRRRGCGQKGAGDGSARGEGSEGEQRGGDECSEGGYAGG